MVEEGIVHSFRNGFNYETARVGTGASIKNIQSAVAHPQPVDKYVEEELEADCMIKSKEEEVTTAVNVSPMRQ